MNEEKMKQTINTALDEHEQGLPAHIQSALTQARYSAVSAAATKASTKQMPWLWRGGAVLASMTLVFVLSQPMMTGSVSEVPSVFDDIELLAAEEGLEFYDDLEFIAWIDEMEQSG